MGVVMIRCPATGRELATGIRMTHSEFQRMPVFFARCYCQFCRSEHEWFARDAWIEDEPLPHEGRAA